MNLNMDTNMLLSVVNTKLRNHYDTLDDLCKSENLDKHALLIKLRSADFTYNEAHNQFVSQEKLSS